MNVSVEHLLYIHTIYEDYKDVEWVKIGKSNVLFKVNNETHVIPIKKIVNFIITQ